MGTATYSVTTGDLTAETSDTSHGGFFFDARFGGMLSSRLGLSIELWSNGHRIETIDTDEASITQTTLGLAATYWLNRRLWFKAGLGISGLSRYENGDSVEDAEGTSLTAAIGYEIMHRGNWAVDLSLRLVASRYDEEALQFQRSSFAFNLGLTRF